MVTVTGHWKETSHDIHLLEGTEKKEPKSYLSEWQPSSVKTGSLIMRLQHGCVCVIQLLIDTFHRPRLSIQ
jgi:hypothetical protein